MVIKLKTINILMFLILSLLIISCGGDPMPPRNYYNIDRIYSIDLDGNNRKLLTVGSNFSLLSNNKIIFINDHKLYSCNSEGTDQVIITPTNLYIGNYQIFSKETKILLNYYYLPYLINIDGSELEPINWAKNTELHYIAISPDGNKICYANNSGLYNINSDGSNSFRIKDTTGQKSYGSINFTSDGKKIVYIVDIRSGIAIDLRLYDMEKKQDTSLFYNDNGNKIRAYSTSKWNTLLFSNGDGVNLENLNNYTHSFLYRGGDPYFSNDSTKITFMNYGFTAICVMDLKDNSTKTINVNLPNNYIHHPILSLDGEHVFFQADTSWSVLIKSNNNIVY